ncbi:hypothetical protein PHJA_000341500 [Phtheirospermum japonicum]|uniref:Uncharacterized protein n=1 Tax=Phtheirospermum japonicum TaxID=374723 RepID=A0A830B818_9LAMI|nr:hypothetical protein PHJA_000341500 [Phtheirospermum japonicum]
MFRSPYRLLMPPFRYREYAKTLCRYSAKPLVFPYRLQVLFYSAQLQVQRQLEPMLLRLLVIVQKLPKRRWQPRQLHHRLRHPRLLNLHWVRVQIRELDQLSNPT